MSQDKYVRDRIEEESSEQNKKRENEIEKEGGTG